MPAYEPPDMTVAWLLEVGVHDADQEELILLWSTAAPPGYRPHL